MSAPRCNRPLNGGRHVCRYPAGHSEPCHPHMNARSAAAVREYEQTCQDCHGVPDPDECEPCARCDNTSRLRITERPAYPTTAGSR